MAGQKGAQMPSPGRTRDDRIEFRTTSASRAVIERAVEASHTNLTEFAETNLVLAAERVLADRDRFSLSADAAEEWESINARPARELAGLRRLMERPSPFDD